MPDLSDEERAEFIRELDAAADYVDVTREEVDFLEQHLNTTTFTDAQCDVIDCMWDRYRGQI